MSEQYTPGPWTLTHKRGSNFAVQEFELRGMFGSKPNVYPIFNRNSTAIDGATVFCSPENACLIAAAPEMFAALRRLSSEANFKTDGHSQLCGCCVCEAHAVIAKAEGREP